MITHVDVPSNRFAPEADLLLVRPRALPRGEVKEGTLVLEMEQNTSVVDRPTLGVVVSVGIEIEPEYVGKTLIWVEHDGVDIELEDGLFVMLQKKSLLGEVKLD